MKKIFLFAAAVLAATTMNATTGLWQCDGTAPAVGTVVADPATITIEFLTKNSEKTYGVESAVYDLSVPEDMKSQGTKAIKMGASDLYIKVYPSKAGEKFHVGDTLFICGYNPWKVSRSESLSGDIFSSIATGSAKNDYKVGYAIFKEDVEALYLCRANGTSTGIAALKIAEFVDPGTPMLSADKNVLDLRIERSGAESKVDSFVLNGIHLDNVTPLSITMPNYAGLSISSTDIVPAADGTVSAKYFVTYAPLTEVEEFNGSIVVKAGDIEFAIAVNCNIKVPQAELVKVDSDIAWNFDGCIDKDVNPYSTSDTIIFFNLAEGWSASFAEDKLAGCGKYMLSKKCFQGRALVFEAAVAGKVSLSYSNTGNNNPTRTVTINGVKVGDGSSNQDPVAVTDYDVPAGMVVICAVEGDAPQQVNFYSLSFKAGETTAIEHTAVEAKSFKRVENGQVVIIKADGRKFNLLGAEIK